jgi:quercetin dioxygenase-like cupin family protein
MTSYPHPHTIEDGNGSRLTFEGIERDEHGEHLVVTNAVAPGGGPPMHVHHLQEESLTVERGTLAYQVAGEPERSAGPGETVEFAAGVPHRFWNAGDDELRCSGRISPPHNVEYFLTQIYDSTRRSGGHRPGAFDGAWLSRRYRSEFALTDIPAPVQRIVFPVQVAVGRMLGWHHRFDGAPEPVRGR